MQARAAELAEGPLQVLHRGPWIQTIRSASARSAGDVVEAADGDALRLDDVDDAVELVDGAGDLAAVEVVGAGGIAAEDGPEGVAAGGRLGGGPVVRTGLSGDSIGGT